MAEGWQRGGGRWTFEDSLSPTSRHLGVVLLIVTLACVAIAVIAWTSAWIVSFMIAAASTALAVTAAGLAWWGWRRAASVLVVLLMLGATLTSAVRGDGLHDVTLVIIPAAILVSSLLLEWRTTAAFTLVAVAGVVGVAWSRHARGVAASSEADWIQESAVVVVVLVIVTLVIQLLVGDLIASVRLSRESEARYRDIFESIQDAYCELAPDGVLLEMSPSGEGLLGVGRDELRGRTLVGEFFAPAAFGELAARVESSGHVDNFEIVLRDAAGQARTLLVNGSWRPGDVGRPPRILASMRDVTERQELRERLARVEQLETVGALAGGIAHDFNNLVNVIRGQCEVARRRASRGESLEPSIDAILRASARGGTLVQALLTFARRQSCQPRLVDLNQLIAGVPSLPEAADIHGVDLQIDLGEGVPHVMADPGQVEQVLVNLIANARHAVRARPDRVESGVVTVVTSARKDPAPGFAVIEVRDNGQGMSDAVRRRVFEPFFTTRPDGTGLGLASVFGIVRQNGGTIDVESREGRGSTFRILWPAALPHPQPTGEV
jgi:PAS domain S-box-containing protein